MNEPSPPLAGVIGWPVSHSRSPLLHRHWLQRYGLAGYFVPIALRPIDFEAGFRALPGLGFRGVNITIPFKEKVLTLADAVTDRAALIGAANTIVFRDSGVISADNTDGHGFISNLRQHAPEWRGDAGPALVLGAGGAARAIVSALLSDGAPEVRIANRTRQRAETLKDQFGAKITIVDWHKAASAMDGAKTIVNTTALGMLDKPELTVSLNDAPQDALVTDIVYTPLLTGFLLRAQDRGLRTVDGLGMLLHQAAPGFESWFGQRPEVDDALRAAVLRK